jgi:3-hydroxybutyryl-CoA dehydrogenase
MPRKITKVVVVGAGIMGHGVAQLIAQHGLAVSLVDKNEDLLRKARGWIRDNLEYMVQLGELKPERVEGVFANLTFTDNLPESLPGAGYVLEAITEDFDLKRALWSVLSDKADPDALLASNTSSYDIDALSQGVDGPERIIGTHWFHPPQITPCVEVIPGKQAAPENVALMMDFLTGLGKVPTRCKSGPGFVANRIQMAMAAEAIALVEEGMATPAEVDRIVKTSFGFRLGAYGPFEIMDQAGADTYQSVFQYLYSKLPRDHFKPPEVLAAQVAAGKLGLKTSAGFYEYGPGAADAMRRERDRKFYARLRLVKKEWGEENK